MKSIPPRPSTFLIKLKSWEFWPFGIVQAPLFIYWLWLSMKARSFVFFSASNPGILMGGMFGESKFEVLEKVPAHLRPRTLLVQEGTSLEKIIDKIQRAGLWWPLILKPDLGERGRMVKKIQDMDGLKKYIQEIRGDFLVQEFVGLPLEFGVFYVRHPGDEKGSVTSITGKEMLSVTGDGARTLAELIADNPRACLQWETLAEGYAAQWETVLARDQRLELVSIGNHCLGTKFLNQNHLITDALSDSFDRISKAIPGFYFGRFDLRTASISDLEAGNVMVLELNGCGAEPAHIYQPGYSLWKALGVLFKHWRSIYEISAENHRRGTPYISFAEARRIHQHFKRVTA